MMSLIARAPSTLSSSTSESLVKRSYKSQSLLSAQAEMYDRTVKPVVCSDTSHEHRHHHKFVESKHSASCSEWNVDKAWSSQEWKSDELKDDRTGQPVATSWWKTPNQVSFMRRPSTLFRKKKKITIERRDPLSALKEEHSNSSLVTTKQNQICRWDPDHSWIG